MESIDGKDIQNAENSSNQLNVVSGKGELIINGSLNLSGVYSGKLNISECLVVDKEGILIGEFKVKDLIVFGKIIGTVHVSNLTVLHEGSKISGTLISKEIKKHPDAFITGHQGIKTHSANTAPVLDTNK